MPIQPWRGYDTLYEPRLSALGGMDKVLTQCHIKAARAGRMTDRIGKPRGQTGEASGSGKPRGQTAFHLLLLNLRPIKASRGQTD
jgi:hypothetical protein